MSLSSTGKGHRCGKSRIFGILHSLALTARALTLKKLDDGKDLKKLLGRSCSKTNEIRPELEWQKELCMSGVGALLRFRLPTRT